MSKRLLPVLLASFFFAFLLVLWPASSEAADTDIQNGSFVLFGDAASVSDTGASDGSAAHMGNSGLGWNIQYRNWDFGSLKPGASYEVYARVKVHHAVAAPTGGAFSLAVYDMTNARYVLAERTIAAAATTNDVWADYKIGTFKPDNGVNLLSFYVAQTNNAAQVSDIYVDKFIFREYVPYTIEDNSFLLAGGAALVHEPTAADGSAARMANGPGSGWNIQAPINGARIEAGVPYDVSVVVNTERSNFLRATGDAFGVGVYDATAGAFVSPPKVYTTADDAIKFRYAFVWGITLPASITLNPAHDNRVVFYQVDNAVQYQALRVDKVILTKHTVDDGAAPLISAYPYKISPGNADGLNDTTEINYQLTGTQTVTVTVSNSSHSVVRTLLSGVSQSGSNKLTWDGKNAGGGVVPNDLYTVEVKSGSTVLLSQNVLVQNGVSVTAPAVNTAKDYFPKGVWFEGAAIPKNPTDAAAYAEAAFEKIRDAGMNTVIIANFNPDNPAVFAAVLDEAAACNLKLIIHAYVFRTVYNDALNNDESAMYQAITANLAPLKSHSALFGYLLYDEPPHNNPRLVDTLTDMKRMMETIDPAHPVMVDLSGVHSAEEYYHSTQTQMLTSDPYGALAGRNAGDFTNLGYPNVHYENLLDLLTLQVRRTPANAAPFWTILQAFGQEGWYREPTEPEIRAMTYEAIGRGSKGFYYFMYQTEIDWEGMVDAQGVPTVKYGWISQLLSEIETLKPTILGMRKIANAATASGGGGGSGAYANADVTTHENSATGDKYLVVVNHNVALSAPVTITIDRSKLGIDISGITDVYANAAVTYTASAGSYTISGLSFAPGEGKVLKLTKSAAMQTVSGQDGAFTVFGGAQKNQADVSASDSSSAFQTTGTTAGWNMQWYWNKTSFVPGATYDLYAVVKIKYKHDVVYDANQYPSFPLPTGDAFMAAAFDGTTNTYVTAPITVAAGSMENMFWHTVKIGTFVPSQTHTEYVYVAPAANASQVQAVYVDRFYFVKH